MAVISEVLNTRLPVVKTRTNEDEPPWSDARLAERGVSTLRALPMVFGERLLGALYLKNDRWHGAPRVDGLDPPRLLAAQVAAALQHALALAELRDSERGPREMIEHNADALAVVDAQGRWLHVSSAISALGLVPAELVGRPLAAVVHPDDRAPLAAALDRIRAGDHMLPPLRLRMSAAGGPWRDVELVGRRLPDDPEGLRAGRIVIDLRASPLH